MGDAADHAQRRVRQGARGAVAKRRRRSARGRAVARRRARRGVRGPGHFKVRVSVARRAAAAAALEPQGQAAAAAADALDDSTPQRARADRETVRTTARRPRRPSHGVFLRQRHAPRQRGVREPARPRARAALRLFSELRVALVRPGAVAAGPRDDGNDARRRRLGRRGPRVRGVRRRGRGSARSSPTGSGPASKEGCHQNFDRTSRARFETSSRRLRSRRRWRSPPARWPSASTPRSVRAGILNRSRRVLQDDAVRRRESDLGLA